MATFAAFVKQFQGEDSPFGDFAEDIRRDGSFPKALVSESELIGYLRDKNACREAIETAKEMWEQYNS